MAEEESWRTEFKGFEKEKAGGCEGSGGGE
jgi:hypothetical protein